MKIALFSFLIFLNLQAYAQDPFSKAVKEYTQGDLATAVDLFTGFIRDGEKVSESYMYRGAAKLFLGRLQEAKNDLDSAALLDTMNARVWHFYGKLNLFQGNYAAAVTCNDKSILKEPTYSFAYGDRGNAKTALGNYDDAIADISKAIALEPTEEKFYSDRGFAKLRQGNYKMAIADFDASLKIKQSQKAFANKGLACALLDLHVDAIDNYSNSLKIFPNDGEILYFRAVSYKAINQLDKCCEDLQHSLSLGYIAARDRWMDYKCKGDIK